MQGKQLILHARQAQTDHIVDERRKAPEIDQVHRCTDARGVQVQAGIAFRIGRLFLFRCQRRTPAQAESPYKRVECAGLEIFFQIVGRIYRIDPAPSA